ncbi:MAG: DUF4920 domain-containing protein [Chitinophagales bacterium]
MKKVVYITMLAAIGIFAACGNKKDKDQSNDEMDQLTQSEEAGTDNLVVNAVGGYGKEITADAALDLVQFAKDKSTANGYTGKVSGKVESVCQNKGCWMKLDAGNGETMRVSFKDYGFFVPKDLAGKTVVVEGVAEVKAISVEDQRHFAEDAGKSKEEIEAITEPKDELVFVADGVIVI